MKKKILTILILFLIVGLYVDVRFKHKYYHEFPWPTVCNGDYRQRAFIVQVVVPFRPERESFWFAYGNKHYDYEESKYEYTDRETGEVKESVSTSGCATRSYPTFPVGGFRHLIDLRKWF